MHSNGDIGPNFRRLTEILLPSDKGPHLYERAICLRWTLSDRSSALVLVFMASVEPAVCTFGLRARPALCFLFYFGERGDLSLQQ